MFVQLVGIIYLKHMRIVTGQFLAARPRRFRHITLDGFGHVIGQIIVVA